MESEKKVKMLQTFYSGVLADSVYRMGKEGILDKVTKEKRAEQLQQGKLRAQQLGIQSPEEVFELMTDIFGCANWKVEQMDNGFAAEATSCMVCAMAKKFGDYSPCHIYCLGPMEGQVKGLSEDADFRIKSTLWESNRCRVLVKK